MSATDAVVPLTQSDTMVSASPTTPQRLPHIPGYADLRLLGRGAAGAVYRATHVKLNRPVALKVMHGQAFASDEDHLRFRSEALTVARIQHPHVIQIFDVGDETAIPFIAVELMEGGTLEQKLAAGPLSIAETIRLVFQIARGVGAAHAQGVIHRDLKPANILLTADGLPKVADFGLAKQLGAEGMTMSGAILGTPAYMAPEQASGNIRQLSPRTDVYALGAILYQCLTGAPPFRSDSIAKVLERVRMEVPLPVRYHRPEVPEQLDELVSRCLRKNPSERYATADAVADDLARLMAEWRKVQLAPAKPKGGAALGTFAVVAAVVALALLGFATLRDAGWFDTSRPPVMKDIPSPKSSTPPPANFNIPAP
jgi:serine/threonine-protein kinase